jgi:hypothetical protein
MLESLIASEETVGAIMMTDEQAKAVQELAKLGQKGVDATTSVGKFISTTFGEAIQYYAAAIRDRAASYYLINSVQVAAKTRKKLEVLGVTSFETIAAREAIPLLSAISEEPNETIQDIWANYLANSLNPDKSGVNPNRQLIEVIKNLDPDDIFVLGKISAADLIESREKTLFLTPKDFDCAEDILERSLARLVSMGLFSFSNYAGGLLLTEGGRHKLPCRVRVETGFGEYQSLPLLAFLKEAIEL